MHPTSSFLEKIITLTTAKRNIVFFSFILLGLLLLQLGKIPITPDDYFHQLTLEKHELLEISNPLVDFFSFARGDQEQTLRMTAKIGIPWWVDPDIKIAFFRPLSAATHWLDHQLWPKNYFLQRMHTLLWFFLCCIAIFALFKKIFPQSNIALLGALLFAYSIQHFVPITWIASRNSLLTTLLSLLVFICYYSAVTEKWRLGYYLTPLLLGIGLLFGEATLSITAFLFAIAIFIDQRPKLLALCSLLPSFLVSIIWLYFYVNNGFGSANSGYYLSPSNQPLAYIINTINSLPQFLFAEIFNLPADALRMKLPMAIYIIPIISITLPLLFLLVYVKPLWRKQPLIRFWLVAFILSILPFCAVPPSSRTLCIPGIASIGLLLTIIQYYQAHGINDYKSKLLGFIITLRLLMILMALSISSLIFSTKNPLSTNQFLSLSPYFTQNNITQDHAVFVISQELLQTPSAVAPLLLDKKPLPRSIVDFISPEEAFSITRESDNALIVENQQGRLIKVYNQFHFHHLIRDFVKNPILAGDTFNVADIKIEILESKADTGPSKIRFTFPRSLDNPEYIWLIIDTKQQKFRPFTIPAINKRAHYTITQN